MHHINLDNKTKRTVIRFTLYGLAGLIVILLTVLLVYAAQGYDINRSTGQLIKNGLVLIDSEPVSAEIYVDGTPEGDRTPGRLPLPEGQYSISLEAPNYRTWQRHVSVVGSEVLWLYYALLVPDRVRYTSVKQLPSLQLSAHSPDTKKILVGYGDKQLAFELYRTDKPEEAPGQFSLPPALFSGSDKRNLSVIEWSTNNRHVLLKHNYGGKKEFILLDTETPNQSQNLTRAFAFPFDNLRLKDGSIKEAITVRNQELRLINIEQETISSPQATDVYAHTVRGNSVIVIKRSDKKTILQQIDGDKITRLYNFGERAKNNFMLQRTNYDGKEFLAVWDRNRSKVQLFVNPSQLPEGEQTLKPVVTLDMNNTQHVAFAPAGRFLMAQSKNRYSIYDIDQEDLYRYQLKGDVGKQKTQWIDSHHLVQNLKGKLTIFDFDGSNRNVLVQSMAAQPVYAAPELEFIYVFRVTGNKKRPGLGYVNMRVIR